MVVNSECALYLCDCTEPTLYSRGSNPQTLAHQDRQMPDLPPAGLVLASTRRLPTTSRQFGLPIQFLESSVQLAELFGELIDLLLQLRN
jgi:hypothetical protein